MDDFSLLLGVRLVRLGFEQVLVDLYDFVVRYNSDSLPNRGFHCLTTENRI